MNRATPLVLLAALAAGLTAACNVSINDPIVLADGETRDGGLNAVNGSIDIGEGCTVRGTSQSVNGGIEVGARSQVAALKTVNGRIAVGESVQVRDDIESINGSISLRAGAEVQGEISTTNGRIELMGAVVGEDLRTLNGDIDLSDGARVEGSIVIEDVFGTNEREDPLEIVLANGSTVAGDILVERDDFAVKVYLRDGSRVLGTIDGAEVSEAP